MAEATKRIDDVRRELQILIDGGGSRIAEGADEELGRVRNLVAALEAELAAARDREQGVHAFAEHLVAFAESYGPREQNTAVQWAAREACRDHGSIVLDLLSAELSC